MVNADLKISVNGQINIVPCGRLRLRYNLHNASHIVDYQVAVAFPSLKIGFHLFFNSGTPHHIIKLVLGILFAQFFQMILLHFPCISYNRSKINTVIINADSRFFNINSL